MNPEQLRLFEKHHILLWMIWLWGHGLALQKQVRELCVRLGVYASAQMADQAVRELKSAQMLKRQTFVDHKSDMLLLCKGTLALLMEKERRDVSALKKATTNETAMRSVVRLELVSRLVDLLARSDNPQTFGSICMALHRRNCTYTLRLPDLYPFFRDKSEIFGQEEPREYAYQLAQMEASHGKVLHPATPKEPGTSLNPQLLPPSLDRLHRSGVWLEGIYPKEVRFYIYSGSLSGPARMVDKMVLTHTWARSLLPSRVVTVILYTYDEALANRWKAVFLHDCYLEDRLQRLYRIPQGGIHVAVRSLGLGERYCGGAVPV